MPRRNRKTIWKVLLPLGLAALLVAVLRRRPDEWEYGTAAPEPPAASTPTEERPAPRRPAARFAAAAGFTALFFAGAAFTAGAGDQAARLLQNDQAASAEAVEIAAASEPGTETAEVPAAAVEAAPEAAPAPVTEPETAPAPTPEPAPEPAPAPEPEPAAAVPAAVAEPEQVPAVDTAASAPLEVTGPAAAAPERVQPTAAPAPAARPVVGPQSVRPQPTRKWVVKRAAQQPARAPEIEHPQGEPVIWLNRALPDPTPASARLARGFARQLASISRAHGADWAAVLGVLRAQGERGAVPATAGELETLARTLGRHDDAWKGALAISGRTAFADRAGALADLYRSVGIEALVTGYAAAKDRLVRELLDREGVLVYDGGRADLEAGRIDVRIVVLLGYLAERHGGVTVSSLFTGHRKYARPGVVSAHVYGHAVDVAAVGGTPVAGNQQPGGTTEAAVRSVLLLPSELQPQQVISLLGLGGPSFPLRDHGDHIHVGY